jgi:phthalate 4,5-dioxygenase oxygenase subunit
VLSSQDNEALCRVGAGTLMGELFRRYWLPVCLTAEIAEPDGPPLRTRVLGERLVAFRDSSGTVGLVQEECPHRGASLLFARNEEYGLRCAYHGWKFDTLGRCVDQPSERRSFAEQIRIVSYPTYESGGLVWAYMGPPETLTPFRDFGTEGLQPCDWRATKELIECNWVQSLDGDFDTAHISSLHQYFAIKDIPDDGTDRPGYPSNYMSMKFWLADPKPLVEVEDAWHGFRYAGIRRTPNGWLDARVSAFIYPSIAIIGFVPFATRYIFLVPIDDTMTCRYTFTTHAAAHAGAEDLGGPPFFTVPGYPYETGEPQEQFTNRRYRLDNDYLIDRDAQKSVSWSGIRNFRAQDLMVTETAGPLYDRSREHLGSGDLAVVRLHQLLLEAARRLASGGEAPALAGSGDFRSVRGAEKVLEEGEDWRILGTNEDPTVKELMARTGGRGLNW